MARLKRGATPAEQELFRAGNDTIWAVALDLAAKEAEHNLVCAEPDCAGQIFPWLNENLRSRKEAIVFCATILERLADGAADWALLTATADEP